MADEKDEIRHKLTDDAVVTIGEHHITLRGPGGAKIVVDATGITLDNGKGAKITLVGPTVDVNSGALTVT